jgi:hypothetical protein
LTTARALPQSHLSKGTTSARALARAAWKGASVQEHVHTGPVAFLFAGIAAIVVINLVKLASAELVKRPTTEGAGKVLGSLVHLG